MKLMLLLLYIVHETYGRPKMTEVEKSLGKTSMGQRVAALTDLQVPRSAKMGYGTLNFCKIGT